MTHDPHWLSAADWKRAQDTLPIACCDVVAVRLDGRRRVEAVGLIRRETPHQGRRWCILGGRLRRDEAFAAAAARQVRETLGGAVAFEPVGVDRQPDHVAQYFTTDRPDGLLDPRQHAVTAVFVVPLLGGPVTAGGEAIEFRWFRADALPPAGEWGFGQDAVAAACLGRWAARLGATPAGP